MPDIDMRDWKRFDEAVTAGYEAAVAALQRPHGLINAPETDAIGAQRVAKRCQRLIEKRAITHAQSPHGQLVTASIGLGTIMPNDRMSTTDFLQAVDRQLYAAKQNGRNRIETVAL